MEGFGDPRTSIVPFFGTGLLEVGVLSNSFPPSHGKASQDNTPQEVDGECGYSMSAIIEQSSANLEKVGELVGWS